MRRFATCLAAVTALSLALGATGAAAAPPTILKSGFSHVTTNSVRLEAEIDPQGIATKYRFEYGAADCASSTCTRIPVPEGKVSAAGPESVEVNVVGLAERTTYHFRVVANNGEKSETPDRTFTTYAPPQVFESCPNDALRTSRPSGALPDCRAYEQASPIDKNGLNALGRVSLAKASINGDAVSYGAAGGISGAEGAQELPTYLASRSTSGWSTQGLFPPQSAGQATFLIGWTPDFSQTFSKATKLGPPGDTAFLGRSSSTKAITEIAPYGKGLFEPSFAGTSAGAAQVVFESTAKLLPAAVAGKSNVYIWDKATGKLSLASALNSESAEGEAPALGAFAGSYDWIAGTNATSLQRGGAGASYYTQDQHAVSTGGSVIFTSGADGQLYLRRNPTQKQSKLDGEGKCTEATLACTLHVSATQKTNGIGPGGTDAAGTRPAAFLAAATDGSSVLFSSTEKLTNDATTGPEPPPAAIGRSNIDGSAVNVDPGLCQAISKGVAVDGSHIYWASPDAGTISRSDLECKSSATEVVVAGANNPQYVAVDAGHLYWTNAGDGKAGTGTIGRAKLDGNEANQEFIKGATNPQGVAVDAEHIYWANAGEVDATRTIGRAKLDGTEASQTFIAVGGGSEENRPQGIAVNATHIYMTIDGAQQFSFIFRYGIDGDPASQVFAGNGGLNIGGIALDATHVYWSRQGADTIGRINLALEESSREREFIKAAGHPLGLAADATHLYWAVNGEVPANLGNDLYRYVAATGKVSDLAVDTSDANGVEVKGILGASQDASSVYFVANGVPGGVVNSPNGQGESAAPGDCKGTGIGTGNFNFTGQCNLYLAQEGKPTAFIARLDANGQGSDARNWLPRGAFEVQFEKSARVSADGSAVLFFSQRQLSGYDNEGIPELYRYAAGAAGPICVSCNPSGETPVTGAGFGNISLSTQIPVEFNYVLSRNLSADGNRAFFQSADGLVGADTNGEGGCPAQVTGDYSFPSCQDVYEWEAKGTGSCKEGTQGGGCLYLLSRGKSPHTSFLADASASGNDVFLMTSEAGLVRQDKDQLYDVFDVRVGGGLAFQDQVTPDPCEGSDACRGQASAPPAFESPPSATFKGPGNPKPTCPKGKRKVSSKGKSRCVAKKQHKPHHKRQAKKSGRASR